MERTRQNKKPSLILCSDFHLREDIPICFTGDWHQEQWKAVEFIRDLQAQYKCPVIHAGDLFDHWKPSPWLIAQAIDLLPKEFYTIYGQHDLPQHNWELRGKSGLNTLKVAEVVQVLKRDRYFNDSLFVDGIHWGESVEREWKQIKDIKKINPPESQINPMPKTNARHILVWHHLTYTTPPFPGATGGNAIGILKKYPQFDLIVTGDNHQSFYTEYQGRLLVNPGNLTRQTADQADYQPRVALWYAETNTIEWANIPIQKDVISREHIVVKERRNERIEAFISKLNGDWEAGLSFEENLEQFFNKNDIRNSVKEIVYKMTEQ